MSIKMKSSAVMLAGSAAMLLAGCASDDKMAKSEAKSMDTALGQCHGANSCKGTSACATATTACAGQNACKGQGWISASKADCDAKGGKFVAKK